MSTFLGCSKLIFLLINLYLLGLAYSNVEIPRPRGVPLSRVGLYDPEKNFTCFDGSKTILFNQVNDDYCDCIDSSDEPGTSACAGGSFYCTNAGFKPTILPSDRVNDGICDCCDGSDEYLGRKSCVNNCLEIGRAAREEAARLAELLQVGKQLRAELGQEGQKLKNEKQVKLNELQKSKDEAEKLKAEKEELKKKIEEAESKALEYYRELERELQKKKSEAEAEKQKEEALENFKKLDSNQDGIIDVAEIQTRQSFDRDRNGEVSEEEAKLFLNNEDSVDVNVFLDKSWSLMKPFLQLDSGLYKPPAAGSDAEQLQHDNEEQDEGEAGDGEAEEENENEDEEYDDVAEKQQEEEVVDERVPYDEETQKLVDEATDARQQFTEADNNVRSINDQIRDLEASLKKDFGPDEEFATLEGQCFEYQDHEYVYKLCPFDKTLQIPKSSSMDTNLGKWSRWDGPSSNPYVLMLYENGQNCWNGPNRSTRVRLSCGTENKITSVSEPNRCEYAFDFETPAACRELTTDGSRGDMHDEL